MIVARLRWTLLAPCIALMLVAGAAGQTATDSKPAARPIDVQQLLSWLPADTETVIVARDFALPDFATLKNRPEAYTQELLFAGLALGPWGINEALATYFKNERALLAVGGARKFRPPKSLGSMRFEGCTFVVFEEDISNRAQQYFKAASGTALRVEEVEGYKILAFQKRLEADTWTAFVGVARSNVLVVATNIDYLREVLSRIRGKHGPRAIPENSREWSYVDTSAQFWGVRHFDRAQRNEDPSSPFWDASKFVQSPWTDEQAIGLTFSYDPAKGKTAAIAYLSGDPSAGRDALSLRHEGRKIDVSLRDLDARAIVASYNLERPEAILFTFFLGHFLGHGIFL